jgi:hypothetical protein
MSTISDIFGKDLTAIYPIVIRIIDNLKVKDYHFLNDSDYNLILQNDYKKASKIYWSENFNRIHLSCLLNLVRTIRWVESSKLNYDNNNHLGFCASIRGLLESTGDSFDVLSKVPNCLLENFSLISGVFNDTTEQFVNCKELEDGLISFLYASKTIFNNHKDNRYEPKSNKFYISTIDEKSNGELYEFYSKLCEVVHPSYFSLGIYTNRFLDKNEKIQINSKTDLILNQVLIDTNKENLIKLFALSVMPSLVNLRIVNLFDIEFYNLASINDIEFEQFDNWNELVKLKK